MYSKLEWEGLIGDDCSLSQIACSFTLKCRMLRLARYVHAVSLLFGLPGGWQTSKQMQPLFHVKLISATRCDTFIWFGLFQKLDCKRVFYLACSNRVKRRRFGRFGVLNRFHFAKRPMPSWQVSTPTPHLPSQQAEKSEVFLAAKWHVASIPLEGSNLVKSDDRTVRLWLSFWSQWRDHFASAGKQVASSIDFVSHVFFFSNFDDFLGCRVAVKRTSFGFEVLGTLCQASYQFLQLR